MKRLLKTLFFVIIIFTINFAQGFCEQKCITEKSAIIVSPFSWQRPGRSELCWSSFVNCSSYLLPAKSEKEDNKIRIWFMNELRTEANMWLKLQTLNQPLWNNFSKFVSRGNTTNFVFLEDKKCGVSIKKTELLVFK